MLPRSASSRRHRASSQSKSEYADIRKKCWAKKDAIQEYHADKVQFEAISAVLKPDRPVRFAIKDKIIRKEYYDLYMQIPDFKKVYDFLVENLKCVEE